jgi:hypothetical protein
MGSYLNTLLRNEIWMQRASPADAAQKWRNYKAKNGLVKFTMARLDLRFHRTLDDLNAFDFAVLFQFDRHKIDPPRALGVFLVPR